MTHAATIAKAVRAFDLPGRVDALMVELGGKPAEIAKGIWWLETQHGPLSVEASANSVKCVFMQPSRAYKHLRDVAYPSGVWPFPVSLKDATGTTETITILSGLLARFERRVRAITTSTNLTTPVVGETSESMPTRSPK